MICNISHQKGISKWVSGRVIVSGSLVIALRPWENKTSHKVMTLENNNVERKKKVWSKFFRTGKLFCVKWYQHILSILGGGKSVRVFSLFFLSLPFSSIPSVLPLSLFLYLFFSVSSSIYIYTRFYLFSICFLLLLGAT